MDAISVHSRMSTVSHMTRTPMALCEGWIEYKAHTQGGSVYTKVYMLLEDNVLYIFGSDKPSQESQIGNLTLDKDTRFNIHKGDSKNGYKFDLRTKVTSGMRMNRFKTMKHAEVELWRGYIVGISKGTVPSNLDLLETQVEQIRADVTAYHSGTTYPGAQCVPKRPESVHTAGVDSGIESMYNKSNRSGGSGGDSDRSKSGSSGSHTLQGGGPTMVHKFYRDRSRDQNPPPWFFDNVSREKASEILKTALECNLGNTLMRESTTHIKSGSYVISKIGRNKSTGAIEFEHFEVIRTSGGYKLNIENEHAPMKCLDDVMRYFIETSGRTTHPLTTNNLDNLGFQLDPYSTRIPQPSTSNEPPPAENDVYYNQPDYDDPAPSRGWDQPRPGFTTVSPASRILRSQPSDEASRRLGSQQLYTHNTYSGSRRENREPVPNMAELELRSQASVELENLNNVIVGFEPVSEDTYYNCNPLSRRKSVMVNDVTAPAPRPHAMGQQHGYVNEEAGHLDELPVAPPPPRHPIVTEESPPVSRTSSTSSPRPRVGLQQSKSFSYGPTSPTSASGGAGAAESSTPSALQQQLNKVALRHVKTDNEMSTPTNLQSSQQRKMATKSMSDTQIKNFVTAPKVMSSPNQLPAWKQKQSSIPSNNSNNSSDMTGKSHFTDKPRSASVFFDSTDSSHSGSGDVDERTPGGVNTLIGKFNVQNSPGQTPQIMKKGKERQRWTIATFEEDHIYEIDPDEMPPGTQTNINSMKTNTSPYYSYGGGYASKIRISSPATAEKRAPARIGGGDVIHDETYDDPAVYTPDNSEPKKVQFENPLPSLPVVAPKPSTQRRGSAPAIAITENQLKEHKKVQFENPLPSLPVVAPKLSTQRRGSAPAIAITENQLEGLTSGFKQKLELMLSGGEANTVGSSKTLPARSDPTKPLSPENRKNMPLPATPNEQEFHEYEELPENHIPPDHVTYFNEDFN